jgi:hypothetical protein
MIFPPTYAYFCEYSRRWVVCGRELHCGDLFDVAFNDQWHTVRIEHSNDWYLIGLPAGAPRDIGALPVRRAGGR